MSKTNIRVDQSHCNYHLGLALIERDWEVHFVDPGRSSRGGSGSQGQCLRIFESNSLPIPDLVATKDDQLLLVEIDNPYSKAKKSLLKYKEEEQKILREFNSRNISGDRVLHLVNAFCRMSVTKNLTSYSINLLQDNIEIDLLVLFEEASRPLFYQR